MIMRVPPLSIMSVLQTKNRAENDREKGRVKRERGSRVTRKLTDGARKETPTMGPRRRTCTEDAATGNGDARVKLGWRGRKAVLCT
ncbi:hypothetical protein M6B38_229670 [Iris pallida]|uniref:Uncharacterized protein n=1 Tax=Iris pallida TaxID=29817 RepID=A0AAX6DRU9_IRIPA|nr:hypothetical protein M6B38_229670 [Iris pallida]